VASSRPPVQHDDASLLVGAADAHASPHADIDLATAALYHRIRTSPEHRAFIARVDSGEPPPPTGPPPRIFIMPGAFHVEHPHTGAGGERVVQLAARLGWPVERVPVRSLAPMTENATALVHFLSRRPGQPTIVVSLSKGGADVRAAIERPDAGEALRDVRAWVNLSGIVTGTPLVGWLRDRPLRCLGVRLLLRLRRQRFADVAELCHADVTRLARPFALPSGLRAIHVFGFPRVRDLSNDWARRAHARLAPLGPNDGGGILLDDVARLPGHVYPVWGADHYLRPPWDVNLLLLSILREAALPAPSASFAMRHA
jgi:hypothetical protein